MRWFKFKGLKIQEKKGLYSFPKIDLFFLIILKKNKKKS